MRLLADENVPLPSVIRLRDAGHDVATVAAGASDREVLAQAASAERLLVTCDRDFGGLVFREGMPMPFCILLVRSPGRDPEHVGRVLRGLLERNDLSWQNRFTVVRADGVRQRGIRSQR